MENQSITNEMKSKQGAIWGLAQDIWPKMSVETTQVRDDGDGSDGHVEDYFWR